MGLAVALARQQKTVEVQPAAQSAINAKPGSIVATGIKVTSRATETRLYRSQVMFPEGWRSLTREAPFRLPAGGSDVHLLTFSIPAETPAGTYRVRYIVRDSDSSFTPEEVSLEIVVPPVTLLKLILLDAPRYANGGTSFTTRFLLTNEGNTATRVRVTSRSSHAFPVFLDSSNAPLKPRESRELRARVLVPERTERLSHTLEVVTHSLFDSTVAAKASSVVAVIPRAAGREIQYLEYPLTVKVRGAGQDNLFAPQLEVYGVGSLNERRTDRLEVLVRQPETQTKSVLGQRDEYRLTYRTSGVELFAGDLNYSLSTLTEVGRYATGVGGRFALGRFGVGGFYNMTRWIVPSQREAGGYLSAEILKGSSVSVNYLRKEQQTAGDVTSVRGLSTFLTGTTLDAEYGASSKDGRRDNGYALRFDGSRKWISYDLRYVKAGANFAGYYRDINFLSASVSVRPGSNVRLESYLRQEERNLARDTNQVYAPREQYYQMGAGYSDLVSLYYRRTNQSDLFPVPKYRRHEDALQARIGHNFPSVSVFADADIGVVRDELQAQDFPTRRYAVFAGVRPGGTLTISTSAEYATDRSVYTAETQERVSGSITAALMLGQATQAELNFFSSRVNASTAQTYTLIEGSVEHIFPFNHTVSLRARYNTISASSSPAELAYAVEYALPLALPLKRITSVGQLQGAITDEQGRGIPNVLVNAGDAAAVTDGRGVYAFSSLKPGTAFLSVDNASIGLDRITLEPLPMEIPIEGGIETRRDLHVTRSGIVSGTIQFYEMAEREFGDTSAAVVDRGGRPGVFVELSSGVEVLRRVTDNRGRFLFADLRPGKWTLRVAGGDIPSLHVVTPESVQVPLMPGDKQEVALQLRPRRRTIKILEQGKLLQEQKAQPTVPSPSRPEPQKVVPVRPELVKIVPRPPVPETLTRQPCFVYYSRSRKGYVVQTSSWVTKRKAEEVARDVAKAFGHSTFVERVLLPSQRVRYHVVIGVFKERQDAMEICHMMNLR